MKLIFLILSALFFTACSSTHKASNVREPQQITGGQVAPSNSYRDLTQYKGNFSNTSAFTKGVKDELYYALCYVQSECQNIAESVSTRCDQPTVYSAVAAINSVVQSIDAIRASLLSDGPLRANYDKLREGLTASVIKPIVPQLVTGAEYGKPTKSSLDRACKFLENL